MAFSDINSSACVCQARNHTGNVYTRIREAAKTTTYVSYAYAEMETLNVSIIAVGF